MRNLLLKCRCSILFILLLNLILMTGCVSAKEKEYYKNKDNFITEEAVVKNIVCYEEEGCIVLWLTEVDDSYQTSDFIIEGDNFSTVLSRGILKEVTKGDTILFTSAPRLFGNGDFMPVISIAIDGKEILGFEEGYKNLMKMY